MSRNISEALKAHLASETTTLALCWKLVRADSTVMGFTSHDQDITFDDITYLAATGFVPSATKSNSSMAVDNLEVDGILDSDAITESDILAGLYDYAAVEVFLVNFSDLTQGKLIFRTGWLGEISINKQQFTAEIRGISQKLQENIGRVITPLCDANLGDSRCTVDLMDFTFTASVTTVTDNQLFTSSTLTQDAGYFAGGKLTWNSGNNEGLSMEVKEFSSTQVVLALPMPHVIEAGDSFIIIAGCDKTNGTCKATFDNLVNFRGFPAVPGMNSLMSTAGTIG